MKINVDKVYKLNYKYNILIGKTVIDLADTAQVIIIRSELKKEMKGNKYEFL